MLFVRHSELQNFLNAPHKCDLFNM